ncbi:MAG: hypothetical protein JXR40_03405, partial [Pontiellaceae bacterium]|nr:hypothetical protein [Pontiellaceae bacterium]
YVHCNPITHFDPLGLRDETDDEKELFEKFLDYGSKLEDQKQKDALSQSASEMRKEIAALPDSKNDYSKKDHRVETSLSVAKEAINTLLTNPGDYKYAAEKSGVEGGPSTAPKNSWKCNRFVADMYGKVVGFDVSTKPIESKTEKSGYPLRKDSSTGLTWPPNANSLGRGDGSNLRSFTYAKNARSGETTQKSGNIVSFPAPGGIGHTSIAIGQSGIISARGAEGAKFESIDTVYADRPAMVREYTGSGR